MAKTEAELSRRSRLPARVLVLVCEPLFPAAVSQHEVLFGAVVVLVSWHDYLVHAQHLTRDARTRDGQRGGFKGQV